MWYYDHYPERLSQKSTATQEDLDLYLMTNDGRPCIRQGESIVALDLEDQHDELDSHERSEADQEHLFWDEDQNRVTCERVPDVVDHRVFQTPIKNQLDRGTCVCFASLAAIEAIYKKKTNQALDLSEQYANWLFMDKLGQNQCDDGLRTTLAALFLTQDRVCRECLLPYER